MNRTPTKKKMAFSLMRLIAILVLAFITSSAMAQNEFKVNIEGTHIGLLHPKCDWRCGDC